PTRVDDGKDSLPIFLDAEPPAHINLDDDEQSLVGRAIPVALAYLGLAFTVCGLIIAGLPPLSGFVGKLAMLLALLDLQSRSAWTLFALLIGSGLMASMALIRIGMRHFWSSEERPPLRLHVFETLPVALLLSACVLLAVRSEPALAYLRDTAAALHNPAGYIDAVMSAKPLPGALARKTTEGETP